MLCCLIVVCLSSRVGDIWASPVRCCAYRVRCVCCAYSLLCFFDNAALLLVDVFDVLCCCVFALLLSFRTGIWPVCTCVVFSLLLHLAAFVSFRDGCLSAVCFCLCACVCVLFFCVFVCVLVYMYGF